MIRLIDSRTAHVIIGDNAPSWIAIGIDALDGKTTVVEISQNGSLLDKWERDSNNLVLCQWDETRGVFALDGKNEIHDAETPLELEGKWSRSWRTVLHKVMIAWPLSNRGGVEARLWGNFRNLAVVDIEKAMFYLTAVASDLGMASRTPNLVGSRLFEKMMEDYSLVDPDQEDLGLIDAATVKAYGWPRLRDLKTMDNKGSWEDWEDELTRMRLPSTAWLAWRRLKTVIGEVEPAMGQCLVEDLGGGRTDAINKAMLNGGNGTRAWIKCLSRWCRADRLEPSNETIARIGWVDELASTGAWIIASHGHAWHDVDTTGKSWSKSSRDFLEKLDAAGVDGQLAILADVWMQLDAEYWHEAIKMAAEDDQTIDHAMVSLLADDEISSKVWVLTIPLRGIGDGDESVSSSRTVEHDDTSEKTTSSNDTGDSKQANDSKQVMDKKTRSSKENVVTKAAPLSKSKHSSSLQKKNDGNENADHADKVSTGDTETGDQPITGDGMKTGDHDAVEAGVVNVGETAPSALPAGQDRKKRPFQTEDGFIDYSIDIVES